MNHIYKQLLFFAVAFGIMVAMSAEIRQLVGAFAIGWVLADLARTLFPKKNV